MIDTESVASPLALLQVNVNVLVAFSGPTVSLPASGRVPLQSPEALQLSASVDDQVSTAVPPSSMDVELAPRSTVGTGPPDPSDDGAGMKSVDTITSSNSMNVSWRVESGDAFTIEQLYVRRIPKSARTPDEILRQCGLHHEQITKAAGKMVGVVSV